MSEMKRGYRRISTRDRFHIIPWTVDVENAIERGRLLSKLTHAKWERLDLAALRTAAAVLDSVKEPTP